jgi:serine/threonine-protein kinase ATR
MWLTSAHLSRKNNQTSQAYQSVMHAAQLKDSSATIEHARLLWKDGHHRKAIQTLKGAIATNAFVSHDYEESYTESVPVTMDREHHQNMLAARVRELGLLPPVTHTSGSK